MECFPQCEIPVVLTLLVEKVLVVRNIPRVASVDDASYSVCESIPDGGTTTFGLHCALDLIGGRGHTPPEILREAPASVARWSRHLLAYRERRVVEWWWRNELGAWDRCGRYSCGDGSDRNGTDEEAPVL